MRIFLNFCKTPNCGQFAQNAFNMCISEGRNIQIGITEYTPIYIYPHVFFGFHCCWFTCITSRKNLVSWELSLEVLINLPRIWFSTSIYVVPFWVLHMLLTSVRSCKLWRIIINWHDLIFQFCSLFVVLEEFMLSSLVRIPTTCD